MGIDATPHDLRHYFASVQIRGGQSIKVLQALLGHKSAVETWDTYGHLMGDEDNRSRAVIDAASAGGHEMEPPWMGERMAHAKGLRWRTTSAPRPALEADLC